MSCNYLQDIQHESEISFSIWHCPQLNQTNRNSSHFGKASSTCHPPYWISHNSKQPTLPGCLSWRERQNGVWIHGNMEIRGLRTLAQKKRNNIKKWFSAMGARQKMDDWLLACIWDWDVHVRTNGCHWRRGLLSWDSKKVKCFQCKERFSYWEVQAGIRRLWCRFWCQASKWYQSSGKPR